MDMHLLWIERGSGYFTGHNGSNEVMDGYSVHFTEVPEVVFSDKRLRRSSHELLRVKSLHFER